MLLTFDLDLGLLTAAPGHHTPISDAEAKRGDGEDVQIQLVRDGQLWRAPGAAELKFCVKKWGDYADDAPAYALSSGFVFVDELMRYEAAINYNTDLLNAMLIASGSTPNAVVVDLMLEAAYRPSSALTWRRSTNTVRLKLHNNVFRGDETIPGAGTGTELLPTNYLTKDRVIEYLPICTGLTGGGTANLDGLATAAGVRSVNSTVSLIDNTAGIDILRVYELVSGNIAESAPTIIRPDDFHATTNPRVWRLRTARVNFEPDTYLLKSASVEWLSAVVGLTGGGATKLDGVATVARAVESIVVFVDNNSGSPVLRHYELVAGTTAEASPDVIRPDDYHASTNAKVWVQRGGSGSGSGSGSEYLTPGTGIAVVGYYDLPTVVTVGVPTGRIITKQGLPNYAGYIPSDTALQFWLLATAADATSISQGRTEDVVTPTDWHATTNNKKWVQLHPGGYGRTRPLSYKMQQQVPMFIPGIASHLGSTASLAAQPTAGLYADYAPMVCIRLTVSGSPVLYFYQLLPASGDSTSSPDRIRPNDYHASTNDRIWRKLAIG